MHRQVCNIGIHWQHRVIVSHEAQWLGSHGESLPHGGEGMANEMMSGFREFSGLGEASVLDQHFQQTRNQQSGMVPHGCNGDFP